MDNSGLIPGGITSGSLEDLRPRSIDLSSIGFDSLDRDRGSSFEPEFFPGGSDCQSPPQADAGDPSQQPQEGQQEEEPPDIGKVIASMAPGEGD